MGDKKDQIEASFTGKQPTSSSATGMQAFVIDNESNKNTVSYLRQVKLDGKDKMPI